MCKLIDLIKKNILITLLIISMAVVYGLMMFNNGPWYDELYTYYSFISRGPVYAAIHWPVPNNHVGYSVLSACLNIFHNPYISLRGISYIAALLNILLVYILTGEFLKKEYAFVASLIYLAANQVHSLSIQGRGYTLAVSFYLLAVILCVRIFRGNEKLINYIFFAITLISGLYILPSSIYWVLSICVVAGINLLVNKNYKSFLKLFISAVIAALITVGLYAIIWLAIGSNLLSKNPQSSYYGIYQVTIIMKNPLLAAKTGIEYMLATPYIQSIDRAAAIGGMWGYFVDFFDLCYANKGILLCLLYITIMVISGINIIRKRREECDIWLPIYLAISLFLLPVILMIQSVHPYKRVLSFIMVPVSIGMVYLLSLIIDRIKKDKVRKLLKIVIVVICIFNLIRLLCSYDYRRPLADRENDIAAALSQIDVSDIDSICYTDDYQKYVLKFYYNSEPVEGNINEARYVLLSKELLDFNYTEPVWPMLQAYDEDFLKEIKTNYNLLCDSNGYMVYVLK